jgi:hypothetical protein
LLLLAVVAAAAAVVVVVVVFCVLPIPHRFLPGDRDSLVIQTTPTTISPYEQGTTVQYLICFDTVFNVLFRCGDIIPNLMVMA